MADRILCYVVLILSIVTFDNHKLYHQPDIEPQPPTCKINRVKIAQAANPQPTDVL